LRGGGRFAVSNPDGVKLQRLVVSIEFCELRTIVEAEFGAIQ
jgi:hypothetical protein